MKVLFCIYQLDYGDYIALSYLSAVAKDQGHSTHLCVLKDTLLTDIVAELKPDVVAYSANILGFEEMVASHKSAKQIHDFVSIMGGPHVTVNPESFEFTQVDAFCLGEGEEAFADFLKSVEHGDSFDEVLNLLTSKRKNPIRPLIKDLDDLPFPDRDLVLANSFLKDTPKKTFYATRGCPYNCNYCYNNYFHALYRGKGPIPRRFSVNRIIREIQHVKSRYRTDFIKFGDDIFTLRADRWLEEFADIYPEAIGIPFNCWLRIDRVSEDLLSLLKKAGCHSIHLSVDSTSEKIRDEILGRRMKKVDIVETLRMIRSSGLKTFVNYILAAPESLLKDDLDSIAASKKGKVAYLSYSTAVPTKGTVMYDYCVEHRLIDPSTHRSDLADVFRPSTLLCFSNKEKGVRFNIYLLGAVIAKLPFPLDKLAIQMIKIIPPNKLFVFIRNIFFNYDGTVKSQII